MEKSCSRVACNPLRQETARRCDRISLNRPVTIRSVASFVESFGAAFKGRVKAYVIPALLRRTLQTLLDLVHSQVKSSLYIKQLDLT
jgi:hypothetical protein